jgi:hypothetical protein
MHQGMNLLNAVRAARHLGVRVELLRRTGEYRLSHPLVPIRVKCNCRRKSASRKTVRFLQKVAEACAVADHQVLQGAENDEAIHDQVLPPLP